MRLWSPLVKVCTARLSNLMQILAALTTDVRFGKFVYRGFIWVSQASISTRPMDCYCFAPNQTFFKCLIYSDLLKKLKILSTFIWISTGNTNLAATVILSVCEESIYNQDIIDPSQTLRMTNQRTIFCYTPKRIHDKHFTYRYFTK